MSLDTVAGPVPCDLEAERSVLGSAMWDRRLIPEIGDILTGPDFWQPAHEQVWDAINHLADTGQPVDPITVAAELATRGQLVGIGGHVGIADLYGAVTIPAHAVAHARIVHDRAVQRRTLDAAQRIHQMATAATADVAGLIQQAQATLDFFNPAAPAEIYTIADTVAGLLDRIGTPQLAGLPTPWPDLNTRLQGLQPGRLHVIGARPGVGKSLMAQALAEHWAGHHGQGVYLATCEMTRDELALRMLARNSGVNLSTLTDGRYLTDAHWEAIGNASLAMADTHRRLEVSDEPTQTVASIRAGARAMHRKGGLGLVVVDYLQLITPLAGRRDRNREQEVAEMSRALKRLAMELHVPVVAVSQLNRAMTTRSDKRPTLADLRESGAVEQDADVVILLHQPDPDERPWDLEAIVAKNRGGAVGSCRLLQQGWVANIASTAHDPKAVTA